MPLLARPSSSELGARRIANLCRNQKIPAPPRMAMLATARSGAETALTCFVLPNVQDEPRPWLARLVLLGARDVTAMVVGSGALLGACALEINQVDLLVDPRRSTFHRAVRPKSSPTNATARRCGVPVPSRTQAQEPNHERHTGRSSCGLAR